MRLGGRAAAAIEILSDVETRHRPVSEALKDWGLSHRFAGAGDRAAIGNIVYDALRRRASLAHRMGSDVPRAVVLAVLVDWGHTADTLAATFAGDRFAPSPLTAEEGHRLTQEPTASTPDAVRADVPDWLWDVFADSFEEEAVTEGRALASRPPLDLRVNTLKADRPRVLKALKRFGPRATPIATTGIRFAAPKADGRTPNVQADSAFEKGWFEVQDEASQIVSDLVLAKPGEKVLDFCAGAGGKALALAAAMNNRGQIFAYDSDPARLSPIHARLKRAGTRNVQVRTAGDRKALRDLDGKMDRVVIDAPCTGSGIWRRRPDAKWRLTQDALDKRIAEQKAVLADAAAFLRTGGFLIYITCSVLPMENEAQVYTFIEEHSNFELLSAGEAWEDLYGTEGAKPWSADGCTVTLTPASTGTDGFFFAVLQRLR